MGIWWFITLFLLLLKILHTKKIRQQQSNKEFNPDKLPNGIISDSKRKYTKEQIQTSPHEQVSLAITRNQ